MTVNNCVITANEGIRGGAAIPLKRKFRRTLKNCLTSKGFCSQRTEDQVSWNLDRDIWYHEAMAELVNNVNQSP